MVSVKKAQPKVLPKTGGGLKAKLKKDKKISIVNDENRK